MLTRRDTAKALLASAALPLVPLPAFADGPEEWAAMLADRLNQRLVSNQTARFTLDRFEITQLGGQVQITGVVTLDWAPGQMRRRVEAEGNTPKATFASLEASVCQLFQNACPGTVI